MPARVCIHLFKAGCILKVYDGKDEAGKGRGDRDDVSIAFIMQHARFLDISEWMFLNSVRKISNIIRRFNFKAS